MLLFAPLKLLGRLQRSAHLKYANCTLKSRGAISGMRNRIVHGYSSVDLNIVWEVATRNLPALMPLLETILAQP